MFLADSSVLLLLMLRSPRKAVNNLNGSSGSIKLILDTFCLPRKTKSCRKLVRLWGKTWLLCSVPLNKVHSITTSNTCPISPFILVVCCELCTQIEILNAACVQFGPSLMLPVANFVPKLKFLTQRVSNLAHHCCWLLHRSFLALNAAPTLYSNWNSLRKICSIWAHDYCWLIPAREVLNWNLFTGYIFYMSIGVVLYILLLHEICTDIEILSMKHVNVCP